MTALFVARAVDCSNFIQSLRPIEVAVMTRRGGMVFCDADTERMASTPTNASAITAHSLAFSNPYSASGEIPQSQLSEKANGRKLRME